MAGLGQGSWGQGIASPRREVKWSFLRGHLDLVTEVQEGLLSCTPRPASLCPQSPPSFLLSSSLLGQLLPSPFVEDLDQALRLSEP